MSVIFYSNLTAFKFVEKYFAREGVMDIFTSRQGKKPKKLPGEEEEINAQVIIRRAEAISGLDCVGLSVPKSNQKEKEAVDDKYFYQPL